ncbi:MAG TPA: hypothetical protein VGS19_06980 [Streptosporangiaceae bacterium]|nr:hypothetical protein [Streptosporangiaceae bacterium]
MEDTLYKPLTRLAGVGLVVAALSVGSLASANAQTASGGASLAPHSPALHIRAPHSPGHFVKMSGRTLARLAREGLAARSASTARMVRALTRLEALTHANGDSFNCWDDAWIYANANGDYVSTEFDYTGGGWAMLRARASNVSWWELYGGCRDEVTGQTDLYSDENLDFISAELNYTGGDYGMLRARAVNEGSWEIWYTASDPCQGCWTYFLNGANLLFASAEVGYTGGQYGELRARAVSVGPWEDFYW